MVTRLASPLRAALSATLALAALAGVAHGERRAARTSGGSAPAAPPAAALEIPCLATAADGACTRWALDGFYQSLTATEDGRASHPARISFVGDSITASDHIPGRLREVFGARFGDGGPGFIHISPPRDFCAHHQVRRASGGWTVHSVANQMAADRLLGFGGGTAETTGGGRIRLTPVGAAVARAQVFYLAQPGGGAFDVRVDGAAAATVQTGGAGKLGAVVDVPITGTLRSFDLRARGRVRLFGIVLETARGVVVDNLGVVNASTKTWSRIEPGHWRAQIEQRAPDLMVVMIGANEAIWIGGKKLAAYEGTVRNLLAPIRAAHPDGACLVISPLAMVDYTRKGLPLRPAIPAMVAAQRAAARASGCAFWDIAAWMGNAAGTAAWRKAGLMTNDYAHPTIAGDRRIADALSSALLDGYRTYRRP
jgi:lysophospholipase L1-like esterase